MYHDNVQGCTLAEPGGPWRLTFAHGNYSETTRKVRIDVRTDVWWRHKKIFSDG